MGLDGEGNGKPLQYSCLENPMDGRYHCAKSRCWQTLLEILRGNCSLVFPHCLSSLACGCITPTSDSIITSLMLTFLSLFDEDPCDYTGAPI
uniref:Uncharacterized protein n=1 Tax=Moschus moschiferus TaxID=68415 RepID=A0A8C6FK76_MOSMO